MGGETDKGGGTDRGGAGREGGERGTCLGKEKSKHRKVELEGGE